MRIVREIAMARAWTRTRMVLHAAAVAIGGRGVLIAGPKRAGKSSLLIHCLRAPGAAYVSNDRTLLSLAGPVPTGRGMPAIVSVRRGTLDLFPELSRSVARHKYQAHLTMAECEAGSTTPAMPPEDGDAKVSPAQLCRLLHVPMAGEVAVGALVLPRVDLGSSGMGVHPLSPDEAERRFEAVIFAAASEVRVSDVFRPQRGRLMGDLGDAGALWSRLTRRVPAFECRIGRGAFDELPEPTVLRPILRTLDTQPAPS